MFLCERCQKGREEMCQYFKEHFLEDESGAVVSCPEYQEEEANERPAI